MKRYLEILTELISEFFNRIINKRNTYKCVAYIDDGKSKDKIVDAFEIKEFSRRRAYLIAINALQFKYNGKGIDVRIFNT